MTKAVLTTKVEPTYDDLPSERYHFPRTYLRQVEAAIGDWIVYYEPRRSSGDLSSHGGRQAYFAAAKLERVERDPRRADHFYATVADNSYLEFDRHVRFRDGGWDLRESAGEGRRIDQQGRIRTSGEAGLG
jgi:putative restriction endonuclease